MIFLAVPFGIQWNQVNKAKYMPIKKIKSRKQVRAKRQPKSPIQLIKIELKRLIKPYIASLKPTITALVFLLVSSFAQQLMDKVQLNKPCPPASLENTSFTYFSRYLGVFMAPMVSLQTKAVELEGQTVLAGARVLKITRHAAERMIQRGISKQAIGTAVNTGKLFAYNHANKIVKIGYYSTVSRVFVAVDQQHHKILTVIHNVPAKYIYKLINYISKPLSLNWSDGLAGVEWFVVSMLTVLLLFLIVSVDRKQRVSTFRINSVNLYQY